MNLNDVEEIARKIQTVLFKNSNSFSVGMLKSHFRGSGLQFKEHQVYCHGDDVRFIDWKLLARSNQPYVKTFEEERNVEIVVIIDLSKSMFLGYKGVSKLQMSIEITCLLYLLAEKSKDFIRPILVGDDITVLNKRAGKFGIVELVDNLQKLGIINSNGKIDVSYWPKKKINIDAREKEILKQLAKRKQIVILSDLIEFVSDSFLKRVYFNKQLHCFKTTSPLDENHKNPFSVFGVSGSDDYQVGENLNISSKKISEIEHFLGDKLKKLNVKERYLEDFVKEMV